MAQDRQINEEEISRLPNTSGVYCFFAENDELLYVGKSIHLRDRVRSHFTKPIDTRKARKIYQHTTCIETNTTAGELGALLLELEYIKDRQPLLNRRSRKQKKLVVAREREENGYLYPDITRDPHISLEANQDILGVFRSKKQAQSVIDALAREYNLCRKRLKVETSARDGACFYYQLNKCDGACIGEEAPSRYNKKFRDAFASYRVRSWPYEDAVAITEEAASRADTFVVDNWCLVDAKTKYANGEVETFFPSSQQLDTFNYDTYKTLARFLIDTEMVIGENADIS